MLHSIEKLRLYNLSSNLFHVFEPLPHGDFLLVIDITFLGYLLTLPPLIDNYSAV